MTKVTKITRVGNSAGVILPKDLLDHLALAIGDDVEILKTTRGLEIASPERDFDDQMAVARQVMQNRRRALRELAK